MSYFKKSRGLVEGDLVTWAADWPDERLAGLTLRVTGGVLKPVPNIETAALDRKGKVAARNIRRKRPK